MALTLPPSLVILLLVLVFAAGLHLGRRPHIPLSTIPSPSSLPSAPPASPVHTQAQSQAKGQVPSESPVHPHCSSPLLGELLRWSCNTIVMRAIVRNFFSCYGCVECLRQYEWVGDGPEAGGALPTPPGVEVAIFMHIGIIGRYIEVTQEIVNALRNSGILKIARLFVGYAGAGNLSSILPPHTVVAQGSLTNWEHLTLRALHNYARRHPAAQLLYIHNKAARITIEPNGLRTPPPKAQVLESLTAAAQSLAEYMLRSHDSAGVRAVQQ
eukprot:RCo005246